MGRDKVYGISVIRDDADILAETMPIMAPEFDGILFMDNMSRDNTAEVMRQYGTVFNDPDTAHNQNHKMSWLARKARNMGAEWVVPFDGDELWSTTNGNPINAVLGNQAPRVTSQEALVYDYLPPVEGEAMAFVVGGMGYRKASHNELIKVACRTGAPVFIDHGNHRCAFPVKQGHGLLRVAHFPYRSLTQFKRKVRQGYKAVLEANLPMDFHTHWRHWGPMDDDQLAAEFRALVSEFTSVPNVYDPIQCL